LQTKCFDNTGLEELQPVKQVVRLPDQVIENCRSLLKVSEKTFKPTELKLKLEGRRVQVDKPT
jgi:hypothetical protein